MNTKKEKKVAFVVDSTIGSNINDYNISDMYIVHLTISLNGKEISNKQDNKFFFDAFQKGDKVTTSQPNPQLFVEAFEKQFKTGYKHVVCITLSQKLSGTYNSACKAKEILNNDNITVIDSGNIGPGILFTLEKIKKYIADTNLSYKEILDKVIKVQDEGVFYFSLEDLKQLHINKRINKFKFFIGSLLKIKPILQFHQGILTVKKNVRSQKNCFLYLIKSILEFKKRALRPIDVKLIYVINDNVVRDLKTEIEKLKDPDINVTIFGPISHIISTHLGSEGFGFYLNTSL
ncbi:DegV family protein ['Camptotheca acuminata' phytoplasma]|uniref:DegV family protein n=1 Tax='Camptotheca acuminata' phytoplasma TaxID=3239192 RepID=UPI00351AA005